MSERQTLLSSQCPVSSLTLGIPYRPDGQCLHTMVNSLTGALDALPATITREVIICVNGTGESEAAAIETFAMSSPLAVHNCRVIRSAPGKLTAQRKIVAQRRLHGVLGFVDADVLLAPIALHRLWLALHETDRVQVVYAQPVPVFPRKPNPLHRLLRVHYSLRDRTYVRPFLHGRAFFLREWHDPPPASLPPSGEKDPMSLHLGPLVDDIFLSRVIADRWGPEAIREVRSANVYFDPPDTLRGLYAAGLRAAWEVARLDALYPAHASLQQTVFRRNWSTRSLRRQSLRLRLWHAAYRVLEFTIRTLVSRRVRLARRGIFPIRNRWIQVPGTKGLETTAQLRIR